MQQCDLPLYRPLRLEALRLHPEAFGSSLEEEQDSDLSRMIGRAPSVTLGGLVDGDLVGIAAIVVPAKIKLRHKGHVVGVYVAQPWRRTGLAAALLDCLVTDARANGLITLTLSVTTGNIAARQLYLRRGFETYGVEPLGLRIETGFLDEELMVLRL